MILLQTNNVSIEVIFIAIEGMTVKKIDALIFIIIIL